MSDYGADTNPDMAKAHDLAQSKGFLPLYKSNVMQWTYGTTHIVFKLAHRKSKSNLLIKVLKL